MTEKLAPTPVNILKAGIKYAKGYDKLIIMRALNRIMCVPPKARTYYHWYDVKKDDPNTKYINQDLKRLECETFVRITVNEVEEVFIACSKAYAPVGTVDEKIGRWSMNIYKPRIIINLYEDYKGCGYYSRHDHMAVSYTKLKKDIATLVTGTVHCTPNKYMKPKSELDSYYNKTPYARRVTVARLVDDVKKFSFKSLNEDDAIININYWS